MKGRLVILLVVAGCWWAALGLRLVQLQVLEHDHYVAVAEEQQQATVTVRSPRGTIYDARGRVLAVSVPVDSAWANPQQIDDPAAVARAVASVVDTDEDRLLRVLSSERRWVWVVRKLDQPRAEALRALELTGVHFTTESKRYYPMRELAAAVLGFTGVDDQGLAGLELTYDEVVAGRPVQRTLLRDARQGTAVPPDMPFIEAQPGRDLHLTLDAAIQHAVEQELARAVGETGARGGSVVILDPRTGAILAMASHPGFDPNEFTRFAESRWRNRAIQDAYEPGSTFKLVTAAAALGANVVDPSDVIDCEMGSIRVGGTLIRDHKPFGRLTFRQVIARSSNVGAIKTGLALGREPLYRMTVALGFGRPTGVDLPGESSGILHPAETWRPVHTANIAFGQGLSVTSLQLANAFAAVAAGGTLRRPFAVASVGRGEDGEWLTRHPEELGHPLEPATAREIERLLETVVEEGTGRAAAVPGFRVAGKTGTAQKAEPGGGGYSKSRFVASFTGFAPARRPVMVAAVVIDEPRPPRYHGGEVAAPVFRRIVERALLYLGVPPGELPPVEAGGAMRVGRASGGEATGRAG